MLVVSPANEERRELNAAIRAALKQARLVSNEAAEQTILVGRDLTRQQRGSAHNYEVGDIIRFTRGSRRHALEKDTYATVENVDRARHRLTVRTSDGRAVEYFPSRLTGVAVFRAEQRAFSPGDRIQFRAPDRTLGVANGEFATIVAINSRRTGLRMDDGREISAAPERLRHIDHGYASTSHSSQGATVDRVDRQRRHHPLGAACEPQTILRLDQPCAAWLRRFTPTIEIGFDRRSAATARNPPRWKFSNPS